MFFNKYRVSKKMLKATELEHSRQLGLLKSQLKKENPFDKRINDIQLYVFGFKLKTVMFVTLIFFLILFIYSLII